MIVKPNQNPTRTITFGGEKKQLGEKNEKLKGVKGDTAKYLRMGVSMLVFGAIGYYIVRNKKTGVKIGVTLGSAIVGNVIVSNAIGMYHKNTGDNPLK